jgi:hypothetical protein
MTCLSIVTSPRLRWLNDTSRTRSWAFAAATIADARSTLSASGFSDSTCTPASSAARATGACSAVGVAMLITSRPAVSIISW